MSLLVQPRPPGAARRAARPPQLLYGPSPRRRRTPAGSSAASSASSSSSSWFCSSCPRRWRPHPGCMIRLQSSMSNHIPVSAARPRPPPWPLAPLASRLPRLSPISSMLSLCSVARAASRNAGLRLPSRGPLGSRAHPAAARLGLPPRQRPSPAPPPAGAPLPFSTEKGGGGDLSAAPGRPGPGTKPLCELGCRLPRPPVRPSPRRTPCGGACRSVQAGPPAGKGSASAPWAMPGAPCRGEAEPGGGSEGQDGSASGSLIEA